MPVSGARRLRSTSRDFEPWHSVSRFWDASFERLPDHPVTRGVPPFTIHDECYFHLRCSDPEHVEGGDSDPSITEVAGSCPEMKPCPPYGDIDKDPILGHINDLISMRCSSGLHCMAYAA